MPWTANPSNADLKQSTNVRAAQMAPECQALRASAALTRPPHPLRGAVCLLSIAALLGAGAIPATAGDGDTAEAGLVEELASDAASENAREATESPDGRRGGEGRQQNRADQARRGAGSIKQRQEGRAGSEIKDAVTSAYLNADEAANAAEDAAKSPSPVDVALPDAKPNFDGDANPSESDTSGAGTGIELGFGRAFEITLGPSLINEAGEDVAGAGLTTLETDPGNSFTGGNGNEFITGGNNDGLFDAGLDVLFDGRSGDQVIGPGEPNDETTGARYDPGDTQYDLGKYGIQVGWFQKAPNDQGGRARVPVITAGPFGIQAGSPTRVPVITAGPFSSRASLSGLGQLPDKNNGLFTWTGVTGPGTTDPHIGN